MQGPSQWIPAGRVLCLHVHPRNCDLASVRRKHARRARRQRAAISTIRSVPLLLNELCDVGRNNQRRRRSERSWSPRDDDPARSFKHHDHFIAVVKVHRRLGAGFECLMSDFPICEAITKARVRSMINTRIAESLHVALATTAIATSLLLPSESWRQSRQLQRRVRNAEQIVSGIHFGLVAEDGRQVRNGHPTERFEPSTEESELSIEADRRRR